MAFSLIFSKNEYHHRILRKKWAILKKKSRSFRPFLTDFEVKIPKNTKKSTFLTKNFFRGVYKVDFFEILRNRIHSKSFFQGTQLCRRNFSGIWNTLMGIHVLSKNGGSSRFAMRRFAHDRPKSLQRTLLWRHPLKTNLHWIDGHWR